MLRHEYEPNQAEAFRLTRGLQMIGKHLSPAVIPQQWLATLAGKREFMQMTIGLEVPHALPMRLRIHARSVTIVTGKAGGTQPSGQWHPGARDADTFVLDRFPNIGVIRFKELVSIRSTAAPHPFRTLTHG